jgi:hypothetical protein
MESCVVVIGVGSRKFKMKRGIRQGSALSAQLYSIFIDGLLREVESSKRGTMLTDLTVNIPTQADDICLVAYKSTDMTDLIDIFEITVNDGNFSLPKAQLCTFQEKLSDIIVTVLDSTYSEMRFKNKGCETCWSNFII